MRISAANLVSTVIVSLAACLGLCFTADATAYFQATTTQGGVVTGTISSGTATVDNPPEMPKPAIRIRDSSGVRPAKFGAGGMAPVTQEVAVDTSSISNEEYAKLPLCNPPMVCGNVLGVLPFGAVENCPPQCRMERKLFDPATYGSSTYYGRSEDAVCPPNYAQVAVYKSGPELTFEVQTVQPATLSDVKAMIDGKWTCTTKPTTGTYANICRKDTGDPATSFAGPYVVKTDPSISGTGVTSTDCPYGEGYTEGGAFGISNVLYVCYKDYACYMSQDCKTSVGCKSIYSHYTISYRYNYWLVNCTSPNLLHETGKEVPVGVVCARVHSVLKRP